MDEFCLDPIRDIVSKKNPRRLSQVPLTYTYVYLQLLIGTLVMIGWFGKIITPGESVWGLGDAAWGAEAGGDVSGSGLTVPIFCSVQWALKTEVSL